MFKAILSAAILFSSLSAFAGQSGLVAVKGEAMVVGSYGDWNEVLILNPSLISSQSNLDKKAVDAFVVGADMISISVGVMLAAQDCKEAVVVFQAGEGNILPNANGEENYLVPEAVSFTCINK